MKWQEWLEMAINGWKWLEMDEMDEYDAGESNGMALSQFCLCLVYQSIYISLTVLLSSDPNTVNVEP